MIRAGSAVMQLPPVRVKPAVMVGAQAAVIYPVRAHSAAFEREAYGQIHVQCILPAGLRQEEPGDITLTIIDHERLHQLPADLIAAAADAGAESGHDIFRLRAILLLHFLHSLDGVVTLFRFSFVNCFITALLFKLLLAVESLKLYELPFGSVILEISAILFFLF